METPLVVAWIVGDAVVSLMALAVTDASKRGTVRSSIVRRVRLAPSSITVNVPRLPFRHDAVGDVPADELALAVARVTDTSTRPGDEANEIARTKRHASNLPEPLARTVGADDLDVVG